MKYRIIQKHDGSYRVQTKIKLFGPWHNRSSDFTDFPLPDGNLDGKYGVWTNLDNAERRLAELYFKEQQQNINDLNEKKYKVIKKI